MNKIGFCQACKNKAQGIKTLIGVPHTCAKAFVPGRPSAAKAVEESKLREEALKDRADRLRRMFRNG